MEKSKKILITGLGSIGRRYARILPSIGNFDIYALRSGQGAPCPGVTDLYSWGEVARVSPKVAFITNPTSMHISTALKCTELGMHLFIEKPLDMQLSGLVKLKNAVIAQGLSSYVAYNLRFHPGIITLRDIIKREGFWHANVRCSSWLPAWRPGTDHSKSYSANAVMGGGVVLDLSHDLDYSCYLFGEPVSITGVARHSSNITSDVEDVADLTLNLKSGQHVSVHLDFCSRFPERVVSVSTSKASYQLDLIQGILLKSRNGKITEEHYTVDSDFTYNAEVRYFFSHLGGEIMNDVSEASLLLKKIVKFKCRSGLA